MRGSAKWQAKEILKKLDARGRSKRETRASSGLKSPHNGHDVSPMVHSHQYYSEVLRTAIDLGKYAKENYDVKDMTKIDGQIVKDYLLQKMEQGVSYRTLSNYASHIAKINHGLKQIEPSVPDFSRDIAQFREVARENAARIERGPRFYAQPGKIVSGIRDPAARLVGRLQYELGLRVAEARHIKPDQIRKIDNGTYSLTVQGKGGYRITKELPRDLGHQLVSHIRENGKLDVKYEHYRDQLRESVERAGEEWHGTHGLRHSYAKERMEELTKEGLSRDEALKEVAEMMGHHRPGITEVYLK